MKIFGVGLQFKIIGSIFLVFLLLFSIFAYTQTQKYQQVLQSSYISEAKAVASSLDANIHSRADLTEDILATGIYKNIWLNPDILEIDINLPQANGRLSTFFSNNQDATKTVVDFDNYTVLKNDLLANKTIQYKNQSVLQVITPIHISGQAVGTYQLDFTMESVNQAITDEIKSVVIYYIIIILSFIVLLFLFSKNILKPIKELMMAAQALAAGNLDKRVRVKSQDEVGQLAKSFNHMVENLLAAKKYNENLVQAVPVSLIVTDANLTIQSINSSTVELLDYEVDELVGQKINKIFGEGQAVRKEKIVKGEDFVDLIKNGPIRNFEMIYQTRHLENIPVGVSVSVVHDDNGQVLNILVAAEDLRIYKELEKERLAAERAKREEAEKYVKKLEDLDKLKDDFLDVAAHELKTPLTTILIMSEILKADPKKFKDPTMADQVGLMFGEATRLKKVVDQILTVTKFKNKKDIIKGEDFDIIAAIKKYQPILKSTATLRQQKIKFSLVKAKATVNANPDKLLEVLLNFVDNAIKYGSPDQTIGVSAVVENDEIIVSVKDSGIGIPADKIEQIFSKFDQLEHALSRSQEGLGLGLYICRLIVESYHGHIGVKSVVGQGSTFYFSLPLIKDKK